MGPPASYPPGFPVPYWPSVVVKPETIRGVQTYFVNLVLDIVFGVFALAVGVSSILLPTTSDIGTVFAAVAIVGAASCGLVIVFVINFILSLMSVIRMHHGANEYGPEHAANAKRGVMFKWIGTSLATLAAILAVYLLIAGSAILVGGAVPAVAFVPLLAVIFWTAGVGAKGQMYRFMVRSLQPAETRRWSDLSSVLIPGLGVIGVFIVGYFTVRLLALASNPGAVSPDEAARIVPAIIGGVFLPPGLALIGYIVFLWVYGRTKERLEKGLMTLYASVPSIPAWSYPTPPAGAAAASVATPPASPTAQLSSASPPPANPAPTCPRCGAAAGASDAFCVNCGATLKA